jgi:hypothetical protein
MLGGIAGRHSVLAASNRWFPAPCIDGGHRLESQSIFQIKQVLLQCPITASRIFATRKTGEVVMSPLKIVAVVASLLALSASSALADGFRYSGSPKFGQSYNRDASTPASPSGLNANAQLIEAQRNQPKGGISARGL